MISNVGHMTGFCYERFFSRLTFFSDKSISLPLALRLDDALAVDVAAERRQQQLLVVQLRAEVLPRRHLGHAAVQLGLGPGEERLN